MLPAHRRRGHARALLAEVIAEAEAAERTKLMGDIYDHLPSGAAFATAIGAEPGLEETVNRLVLARLDRDLVASWLAERPERAPGCSLVEFSGPYRDLLAKVRPLHQLMNEAPRDGLDMEDTTVTLEHMQGWEDIFFARGNQRWSYFARNEASGAFVGFTELAQLGFRPYRSHTTWQVATDQVRSYLSSS